MAIVKDRGNPQSVIEPHLDRNPDAPFKRRVPLVVGGPNVAKGRSFSINATGAGTATVLYPDGSTAVLPVGVGYNSFPDAIVGIVSSTATGVFVNEY